MMLYDAGAYGLHTPAPPFVRLSESDFTILQQKYNGGPSIHFTVFSDERGLSFHTEPIVCVDCLKERELRETIERINYTNRLINVLCKFNGFIRLRSTMQVIQVSVNASDTIAMLKLKITDKTEVDPCQQLLLFQDQVLDNDDLTLIECNIEPGAYLKMQELDPQDFIDDPSASTSSQSQPQIYEGFGGLFHSD